MPNRKTPFCWKYAIVVLFGVPFAANAADISESIRVACLGDSITAGARVDAATESYPAQLQEMLGDEYDVKNFGTGGATLIRTGRPNVWQKLDAVKEFQPHIAVISLGTNDTVAGRRKNWEQIAAFDQDYTDLIRELSELPTKPRIVVCTPTSMVLETPGLSADRLANLTERKPRLQTLCGQIRAIADKHSHRNVTLLELNQVLAGKLNLVTAGDGVHPNANGYKAIASAVAAHIRQNQRDNSLNVLIISIDDLNDWTGCLGGHPQAKTPNIDRLAKRGTLFRNAHCQAPICTPSRASLVTGLYPSTTGLYFLQPGLNASPIAMRRPNLLQHFEQAGYRTMGSGKFVHGATEGKYFMEHGGSMGGFGPTPDKKLTYPDGLKLWDWGAFPENEQLMPDTQVADWTIERLNRNYEQPFLLVAGFWRPHVPMYAPPRWFESFPLEKIQLPEVVANDRSDISEYAKRLTIGFPAPRHSWFVDNDGWRSAVQAYLASVAFVDHCVGRVLDALDDSEYSDNTVVVLFSDHGWHLGEKERWAKRSLWNDSTRVPLIVAAPGMPKDQQSDRPVGLIDIFPTLLELTGLPHRDDLEGRSLAPLLQDASMNWSRPILTTFAPLNHSLRSTRWHYIQYADGSEELYDHISDPHEWRNLATSSEHAGLMPRMRDALPKNNAEPIISDWQNWEIEAWREAEQLR